MPIPPQHVESANFIDIEGKLVCDEIYCDPCGGLWLLDGDRRRLRYLNPMTVSQLLSGKLTIDDTSTALPEAPMKAAAIAGGSSSVATVTASVVLECGSSSSSSSGGETVRTVLFLRPPNARGAGGPACVMTCVVTDKGTITSYVVPDGRGMPVVSSCRRFGVPVNCAVAMEPLLAEAQQTPALARPSRLRRGELPDTEELHLLMGCVTDKGSEMVLVSLQDTCQDGMSARGLFSITARIECLLWDALDCNVITVSAAGTVDVWNWRTERDVTACYGSPCWDATSAGGPVTGCALLTQHCLWVGTTLGYIVYSTFDTISGRVGTARMCVCPGHNTPVSYLLPVSLGRAVWSVGDGDRCVRVWGHDGDEAVLQRSFSFPASNLTCLCVAQRTLQSTVWHVRRADDGAANYVRWGAYLVTEPIACTGTDETLWCRTLAEERAVQHRLRRGAQCECLLRRLAAAMCDCRGVLGDTEPFNGQGDSPSSSTADGLEVVSHDQTWVEHDEGQLPSMSTEVGWVVNIARTVATAQLLLRQCSAASEKDNAYDTYDPSCASCTFNTGRSTLLSDVERVVRGYKQNFRTMCEYRDLLAELHRVLRPVTSPTHAAGEVDLLTEAHRVVRALRAYRSEAASPRDESADRGPITNDGDFIVPSPRLSAEEELGTASVTHTAVTEIAQNSSPSSSSRSSREQGLRRELLCAHRALQDERRQRHESEAALDVAQAELRETNAQLAQSRAMLAARENQVELLRRSVQAAREAANVSAAEASRLFAMESKLHAANASMKQMQDELNSLRACADARQSVLSSNVSLKQQLASCRAKKRLMRKFIDDMFRTQNYIATQLNGLADVCRQWRTDEAMTDHHTDITTMVDEKDRRMATYNLTELQNNVLQLSIDVNDQLHQQRRYFYDLHCRSGSDLV